MNIGRADRWGRTVGAMLALAALLLPNLAWAALGGDVVSVQSDAVRMKGAIRSTPRAAYTVHEITDPSGTVVREYISLQGKVFAVSWRGPIRPNLQELLGTHFDQFQQALQSRIYRVRGPAVVETPGLVVQSAGHMRGFVGRAYLPDSVPQGVTVDSLQ
jgi:hypothetical protein